MPLRMTKQEIEAASMLLGEHLILCSCCLGRRYSPGIFGGPRRCGQCEGTGYDYIGPKTKELMDNFEVGK
jgi:hypothetical protein